MWKISFPNLPLVITSQFIWFNKKVFFFSSLSVKGFVRHPFDRGGKLKTCECLKDKFSLTNTKKFKLFQMIHALPKQCHKIVATYDGNLSNVSLPDHNLNKKMKFIPKVSLTVFLTIFFSTLL